MDVNEIKQKKDRLESEILHLISEFELEVRLKLDISIHTLGDDVTIITSVKIN